MLFLGYGSVFPLKLGIMSCEQHCFSEQQNFISFSKSLAYLSLYLTFTIALNVNNAKETNIQVE